MYSPFTMARKYLWYRLTAMNGRGHGMHSPFVYQLIREVMMDKTPYPAYRHPELYRQQIRNNQTVLQVEDLGAGSVSGMTRQRTVASIARYSVKHARYASLLYRLGVFLNTKRVVEMGTSLGVTTMYLAGIPGLERTVTMEGAGAVAGWARDALVRHGFKQVELVEGNFDDTLGRVLHDIVHPDLVYVDGNHRQEPTLRYFEQIIRHLPDHGCIVFDDIHWSREMEHAWQQICADPRVTLTIDLFAIGLVFIRPEHLQKQHFVIRF